MCPGSSGARVGARLEESIPIRRGLRGWLLRRGTGGGGAGTRAEKRWGGGGGGGCGGPGGRGGITCRWVGAAGGRGDGRGECEGLNRTIVFPMVELGVPPLG